MPGESVYFTFGKVIFEFVSHAGGGPTNKDIRQVKLKRSTSTTEISKINLL